MRAILPAVFLCCSFANTTQSSEQPLSSETIDLALQALTRKYDNNQYTPFHLLHKYALICLITKSNLYPPEKTDSIMQQLITNSYIGDTLFFTLATQALYPNPKKQKQQEIKSDVYKKTLHKVIYHDKTSKNQLDTSKKKLKEERNRMITQGSYTISPSKKWHDIEKEIAAIPKHIHLFLRQKNDISLRKMATEIMPKLTKEYTTNNYKNLSPILKTKLIRKITEIKNDWYDKNTDYGKQEKKQENDLSKNIKKGIREEGNILQQPFRKQGIPSAYRDIMITTD